LKIGEHEKTQSFNVLKPADVDTPQADLDAQYDLAMRIHDQLDLTAKTINRMRDLRAQLDGLAKRTKERDGAAEISSEAEKLKERVLDIEKRLEVPDLRSGWADRINNGIRLFEKLASLMNDVELGDYRPTDAAQEHFTDLKGRIDAVIADFDALIAGDLASFNGKAAEAKLPATIA
jgi:hypothetical protein